MKKITQLNFKAKFKSTTQNNKTKFKSITEKNQLRDQDHLNFSKKNLIHYIIHIKPITGLNSHELLLTQTSKLHAEFHF